MIRFLFIFLFFSALNLASQGQSSADVKIDSTAFYNLSLEELMNVNVTVASSLPMTNRESPGIITILTQEEIRKTGANDLIDVLKFVPGFNFCVDVEGVVGIGVRGNWANEGKVLMLWDGIEMNEDLYSTLQFEEHYPIDYIKRIEIIRGPGSAKYGGNAEYAVINIITINNSEFNGINAAVHNSQMSKTFGSRGVSVAAGKSIGATHLILSASLSQGNRSQEIYTDLYGGNYDMTEQSGLKNLHYRLDFTVKGFSLTGLYNAHTVEQRDGYDEIYLRAYKIKFNGGYLNAKYDFKPGKNLTLTPGVRFKLQQPWSYTNEVTDDNFKPYNTQINKLEYYINTNYNPDEKIAIEGGASYFHQLAHQKIDTIFFSNGKNKFNIDNYSLFLQSILKFSPFNVILGCRYDYNPFYGPSLVPRIGLTKVWEKFHLKTLYSTAFRTPSVENINASPDILPEKTVVAELEGGVRLAARSYLTANFFEIKTSNPIIYTYDENDEDVYINESATGTQGFEIEYKWKSRGLYAAINYSFYRKTKESEVSIYQVPGHDNQNIALPTNNINLNANVQITKHININPSLSYISTRYSVIENDDETKETNSHHPAVFANMSLNFDHIIGEGFCVQASCMNLTDEKSLFIQPYNGNHQSLPGQGREYQIKVSYSLSFKK